MKSIWSYVTYLTSFLTLSPVRQDGSKQSLLGPHGRPIVAVHNEVNVINVVTPAESHNINNDLGDKEDVPAFHFPGPKFRPPTGKWKSDFQCDYRNMEDWVPCNDDDRTCWLKMRNPPPQDIYDPRNPKRSGIYGIDTDYERFKPKGIMRNYTLVVEDGQWNADGFTAKDAKLVNGTYPGPLIQACWGDTIRIKVINKLRHNGTAIHWHGIRQNQTMHMDGVPGITQCPIAPNDYYIYQFDAVQYGDSWYHSHYSVQYADGVLGPMMIHGPTTDQWDESRAPLLISDWFHNSAFQVIHEEVPGYPTIVMNGIGDISQHEFIPKDAKGRDMKDPKTGKPLKHRIAPNAPIPPKHQIHVQQGKRYLLRIINTSFSSHFVFSIDDHRMVIVGADFVPVNPTDKRASIQVGIGQRYTVIVEADPVSWKEREGYPPNKNFWIRTTIKPCFRATALGVDKYDQLGIMRYDPADLSLPESHPWQNLIGEEERCSDEKGLVPYIPWDLEKVIPANATSYNLSWSHQYSIESDFENGPKKTYPLGRWAFDRNATNVWFPDWVPLRIDYNDPFFLHLNDLDKQDWKPSWMVVSADYKEDDWVFLLITGQTGSLFRDNRTAAHPIHLHGHDFALLQVEDKPFNPKNFNFTRNNPSRRDVVLVPAGGWVVIAFKADNPGSWIVHCHIAFHASEGLAFQINERQKDANDLWPNDPIHGNVHPAIKESERVCRRWNNFQSDCTQHWPGRDEERNCWQACNTGNEDDKPYACDEVEPEAVKKHWFQDDSGI